MKTQTTAGNWTVEQGNELLPFITTENGELICFAVSGNTQAEATANAQLIAAAPLLAEALLELLKSAEYAAGALDAPEGSTFRENIEIARTALQKAGLVS